MPVPKPKPDEPEREYISRCEKFMHEENDHKPESKKRSNEQISAICYSTCAKTKPKNSMNTGWVEKKKEPAGSRAQTKYLKNDNSCYGISAADKVA